MSSTPKFNRSLRNPFSASSPTKPTVRTKNHTQSLRQLLQERMLELQRAKSEWLSQEIVLHDNCKTIESQLRDLETRYSSDRAAIQSKHLSEMTQQKQRNQTAVRDLEKRLEEALNSPEDTFKESLDDQITALTEELTRLEDSPEPQEDVELFDSDAEERLQQLQDRLDELEQLHEDVLHKRDEDSRKATGMLAQLIAKHEKEERIHQEELRARTDRLNEMDSEQSAKVVQLEKETEEKKSRITASLKSALTKLQQMQQTVARRQKNYNQSLKELQTKADELRADLEIITARQQEQLKEAVGSAKKYAEEKRKHVALNRELELVQTEKMREEIEHATLKKEVSKMDGYVLSQLSSGSNPQLTGSGRGSAKSAPV
jgi:hypothetical protein